MPLIAKQLSERPHPPFGTAGLLYGMALWRGVAQTCMVLYGRSGPAALPPVPRRVGGRVVPPEGNSEVQAGSGKKIFEELLAKNPETVLRYLLEFLGLAYSSNAGLRRRIKGLRARYLFRFADRPSSVAAEFAGGRVTVRPGGIRGPDVCLTFRNGSVMRDLLFSARPDILSAILAQDVSISGNLTYLYKFAFLAKHLQIKVLGAP